MVVSAGLVTRILTTLDLSSCIAGAGVAVKVPGVAHLMGVPFGILAGFGKTVTTVLGGAGHLAIQLAGAGVALLLPGVTKGVLVAVAVAGVPTAPRGAGHLPPIAAAAGVAAHCPGVASLVEVLVSKDKVSKTTMKMIMTLLMHLLGLPLVILAGGYRLGTSSCITDAFLELNCSTVQCSVLQLNYS